MSSSVTAASCSTSSTTGSDTNYLFKESGIKSLVYAFMRVSGSKFINEVASMRACTNSHTVIFITKDGDIIKVDAIDATNVKVKRMVVKDGVEIDEEGKPIIPALLEKVDKNKVHTNEELIEFLMDTIHILEKTYLDSSNTTSAYNDPDDVDKYGGVLLGYGLLWSFADVYGLDEIHQQLLHPNANMLGYTGKSDIIEMKKNNFSTVSKNYSVDSIHQVDCKNLVVVADFDCTILGKAGRGTDVIKFSDFEGNDDPDTKLSWKVLEIQTIRHGGGPLIRWNADGSTGSGSK